MPRVKISEFRAKKLILGDAYNGVSLQDGSQLLPLTKGEVGRELVVKVDQGVKKRFKQGLVRVNIPADEVVQATEEWRAKGFSQFIVEPFLDHAGNEEQYLSLDRVREGIRVLHAAEGGIDIEAHPEAVKSYLIASASDVSTTARSTNIPQPFLESLVKTFSDKMFSFLEINPLIVRGDDVYLLDAAALVDSSGEFFVRGAWTEADIIRSAAKHPAEGRVEELAKTTPASLKLSVLNPNGSLFFLLSGGGGSIVIADEAALEGVGDQIANYGEYSGGPTREETYLYTKEVLGLLLDSTASKKALIVAGGVANFTDVKKTFAGIIDALRQVSAELKKQGVRVFVRRGGPNEAAGLELMRNFLEAEGLLGAVYGSAAPMTQAVEDAVAFIKL